MIFVYLIFDFFSSFIPSILNSSIQNSKYGIFFTAELFWLLLVIVTIYLFKSSYIFSEKKEGLFKTFFIGFPMTIYSIILLIGSITEMKPTSNVNIISLILYCICIGMTEEFMIRGWILNEFLKRYGDKRKYVILSIIFSSLLFGGMHITNIWFAGQTVSETLLQVMFATSAGIFLGALYYRTKNIIAVALLHGFYDFSILLSEVGDLRDCVTNPAVKSIIKYQLFVNLILSIILILSGLVIIRKSKTPELNKKEEKETSFKVKAIIACIILYNLVRIVPPGVFGMNETTNFQICYDYQEINIPNYELNVTNQNSFTFNNNNNTYTFSLVNNNIKLESTNNKEILLTNSGKVLN
jgi:membrane protease YdiL (CAAX protease family)